jgi:preprotein translocase subunit SecD
LATVIGVIAFAVICLMPNWVQTFPGWWQTVFPTKPIHLGLDLQGGIHMVLDVDADKAVQNAVELLADQMKRDLREEEIATRDWKRVGDSALNFELVSSSRVEELKTYIDDTFPGLELKSTEGRKFQYALLPVEVEGIRELAIDQALETIRNRIDQFGVSEPTIQRTGQFGILIQLPGVQDPERAKRLIGRTAQLEFKIVALDADAPGVETLAGVRVDDITGQQTDTTYAIEGGVLMTGEVISDARHRPGQFGDPPYVSITLNSRGAKLFERITEENTGRQLAIVLDGKVQSAPVIRERIGGGRAVITGNFTLDEARDLAIVLRAGALPAPVRIAEERTVGPSLGRDSIASGLRSFQIGAILVAIFMLVPDVARHRGHRVDAGHGGRCERADQRAHSRRVAHRAGRGCSDRRRLQSRVAGDSRLERNDVPGGTGPVPVRFRPHQGVRADPVHRYRQHDLQRRVREPGLPRFDR